MSNIKYSIVIPHWKGWEELLKPCLESIIKNTSNERLKETEIIVVLNGSEDSKKLNDYTNTQEVPLECSINIIEYPNPIGYTRATNAGIKEASGEFVILLNNDCVILDYSEKDEWMNILERPFADKTVGVTGVKKLYCKQAKSSFLVFFLVMIKASVFDVVGYLDESFSPGGGEDIDFCLRLKKHGLRYVKAPKDDENYEYGTEYPVYHAGEKSVHDVPGWEDGFWQRMAVIEQRTNSFEYEEFADVTAYVSTKGRYTTTLPMCIAAIANQTKKPKYLIIFQDDPQAFNMQESSVYKNLLYGLLSKKGIQWSVVFGEGKGQVLNHQKALEISKSEWIWRVDDDNVPEPNVLEGLCKHIGPGIGAIAGSVIDPLAQFGTDVILSGKIKDIRNAGNIQWVKGTGIIEVEHLYSTFLFRKSSSNGYCLDLSPIGGREETIFTHEIYRNGWKLLIDREIVTWHLKEATGGVRSHNSSLWFNDEKIFDKKLIEWEINLSKQIKINLDCGIGDHFMFKNILEKLILNNPNDEILCACCYPAVFDDFVNKYKNLSLISIAAGNSMFGKEEMDKLNVYRFCIEQNWNTHIISAFEKLYLNK